MSDGPKRPPRFPPRSLPDDEVVEIPETVRTTRAPVEPFRRVAVTNADIASKLDEVLASHREILHKQRHMALQTDGLGNIFNQRMDVFHQELALLRATVTADHAPRLEKVEASLGQKVARGGGILGIIIVVLPMLSDVFPKYRHLFDSILGAFQ